MNVPTLKSGPKDIQKMSTQKHTNVIRKTLKKGSLLFRKKKKKNRKKCRKYLKLRPRNNNRIECMIEKHSKWEEQEACKSK